VITNQMKYLLSVLAALMTLGIGAKSQAQGDLNYIVNGGFEKGLNGWTAEGSVGVETSAPLAGTSSLRIGPGRGAVRQKYTIPGLRIVEFGATARLSAIDIPAIIRVRCFDARHRLVMDLTQGFDPKKGTEPKGASTGIYFKTQAFTTSIEVSIEKNTDRPGTVIVDSVELHDYDIDRKDHTPECDVDQYMKPIWQGKTVHNETVLLLSTKGGLASGSLLYQPTHIVSVHDSTLHREFKEGTDFVLDGKTISSISGSTIPSMKDSDFPKGEYPWLSVAGKHIVVTYEHDDQWRGPVPGYEGRQLPHTMERLLGIKPLTIVALGDSITLGINVSGYRMEPPYMPTWAELFAQAIGERYKNRNIKLYNAGLGGMTAQWGADNAQSAVASLNPDLVLIAFGMNDFWSVEPEAFRKSIESTIETIRSKRPKVEFILISSIRFDPAYTKEATYVVHLTSYAHELRSLVRTGVRLLDMTELTDYLYKAKAAKDLMSDPMHPDDFLARWYAQGLVAMLDNPDRH